MFVAVVRKSNRNLDACSRVGLISKVWLCADNLESLVLVVLLFDVFLPHLSSACSGSGPSSDCARPPLRSSGAIARSAHFLLDHRKRDQALPSITPGSQQFMGTLFVSFCSLIIHWTLDSFLLMHFNLCIFCLAAQFAEASSSYEGDAPEGRCRCLLLFPREGARGRFTYLSLFKLYYSMI